MREELPSPGSSLALRSFPGRGSGPGDCFPPPSTAVAPRLLLPGTWELQEGLVGWWLNGKARREDRDTVLLADHLR